ncbi:Hsp70 family protein [Marinilabiliaceae bacterium ANBcel2]|nr:Hsp70 family protein [Marinilabiliaceae bacterium ANBcel2]
MSRIRIDYGIDLGTTNSAIARMENGEPVIKKSDTLKDTIPSINSFNKKKSVVVGDGAWNSLKSDKLKAMKTWRLDSINAFNEFKRSMGTDRTYFSSHMEKSFNSEELSSEVLQKLRSFITDENLESVVITVPAEFDIKQKDATLRSAKMAGFKHCELLQEPIAASMAYGLDGKNKNGYWVVFDFGGGTFDAALVKVEDGIMSVKDTDGDNYLGGKNLDMAIVDEIIIPYLQEEFAIESIMNDQVKRQILQDAMKYYAEEAKIQLSFKDEHNILTDLEDIPGEDDEGNEFELDITLTREQLASVLSPIFQRAVDITKDLLKRNNLSGNNLDALILVGGPTHSPILRDMLAEQIRMPDTNIDPMTAVATGAALYASTIDVSDEVREAGRDKTKVQLDIGFESSTVEVEEFVTLKFLSDKTEGAVPDKIFAEIVRGDNAWSSGKVEINDKGEMIDVLLIEGKSNSFSIIIYDGSGNRLESQPDNFNIIQGSKVGNATLPHNIGIEIKRRRDGKLIFSSAKGLEKNQSLPAKGTINGLKTQKQIRPGITDDVIKIPIYQGDIYSEGTRALDNEHVYNAIITGSDLPALLPEGSDVDLTLVTDKSGRIEKIDAYLPYLDHSIELTIPEERVGEIDYSFLNGEMNKAKGGVQDLKSNHNGNADELSKIEEELEYLQKRLDQGKNDPDRKREVLMNLRKSLKKIDALSEETQWPKLVEDLQEEFSRLEAANNDLGNEASTKIVKDLRTRLDLVIDKQDIESGQSLLEEIRAVFFKLTMIYQLIGFIKHYSENFSNYQWKDSVRARQVLNQAIRIINDNPTKEKLRPAIVDLINLLPPDEKLADDLEVLMR